ncbi:MAG: hypothetical protein KDA55_03290 [Planctomycetales bacterium]|nr:hypothetical protein [Planctomycetales bacterium]
MKMLARTLLSVSTLFAPTLYGADLHAELPNVEDAARAFRIQTYELFRTDRGTYDARRTAADELLEAWKTAPGRADHAEAVSGWYVEAMALTEFNRSAQLPPVPELPAVEETPVLMLDPQLPAAPAIDSAQPEKPAYLDEEAIRALNEASGMVDERTAPAATTPPEPGTAQSTMSAIMGGLKRAVLGD